MKTWLKNYYKGCFFGIVTALSMGPIYYGIIAITNRITNK